MSQPPLSYQMKQLEAELNVTLFERNRTGVTLTEAGKLLYERAENLLNFVNSTKQEVAETGKKQVLRIGMTPTTVGTMMPFISEFARKNPDVNFEVHDGITYTLYHYLMDGIVDVAVVRTPLRLDGVEYTELHQEPMIAVIPTEMRLEREGGLYLTDLMDSPLILYRRYEKFILEAFAAQGLDPDIFCLCDDARGAMLWVREGLAVAVFPESMRCFCEGLHVETLVEPALETKILLIWKKGKQPTSLLQKFLDICMKK